MKSPRERNNFLSTSFVSITRTACNDNTGHFADPPTVEPSRAGRHTRQNATSVASAIEVERRWLVARSLTHSARANQRRSERCRAHDGRVISDVNGSRVLNRSFRERSFAFSGSLGGRRGLGVHRFGWRRPARASLGGEPPQERLLAALLAFRRQRRLQSEQCENES